MVRGRLISGAVVLGLGFVSQTHAVTYSATGDFSLASNPNGVWSYGSEPYAAGVPNASSFTPYNTADPDITNSVGAGPGPIWARYNTPVDPNVTYNHTASAYSNFGITWDPGELSLGPGFTTSAADAATVVRFTAPATGIYNVAANFFDNQTDGNGADVYVYVNGTAVYTANSGSTVGAGPAGYTNPALSLVSGQTVDFVAGAVSGASGNNTQLIATISPVPEPTTLGILGLASLALCGRQRR